MFKNFKYGFTLAETLIVVAILGVISVVTIGSFTKKDSIREKQIDATSKSFYATIDNVYSQILSFNATNGVITAIEDKNTDGVRDSKDLRSLFNSYMDGTDVDCSEIGFNINGSSVAAKSFKNAVCAKYNSNKVIAGYYLDLECKTPVTVKEAFVKGDTSTRTVTSACGYVVYGLKGSKGNIGSDVFVIALGKIGVKS